MSTPQEFIRKWGPGGSSHGLNERQGAQQHFIELCALLGVAAPTGGEDYRFEKGLLALGQQRGFADVFKRGCFAWEYKAPGRPLDAALSQLMRYALALENPPLLIVSDRLRIQVHTHFNGTPSERHVVELHELGDPAQRELLRRAFEAPESFKPRRSNRQITEEAAQAFATTAERLRAEGHAAETVSHFLTQCLFCFFAEDVGLLPARLFEKLVGVRAEPAKLRAGLQQLFTAMQGGGLFGADDIPWFNGGLFQHIEVPPLTDMDMTALRVAAALDWSAIDPSIFGTLFERGLDPKKRSQLGAHYTDPATILRIVEPVVRRPLLAEWDEAKARIAALLTKRDRLREEAAKIPSTSPELKKKFGRVRTEANHVERDAQAVLKAFLERLREYRVLDPACGSGNFLYLALKTLKDIEHQANLEAEALGLQREVDAYTSPANVLGIELNEYAAELARLTVWIGELQWRLQHGYPFKLNPVLEALDHIDCRDAILGFTHPPRNGEQADALPVEAAWPKADAVVGNPPFVGDKKMRAELGDAYTEALRATYKGRVPGGADLVCYWFEKARAQMEGGNLSSVGLVATNVIARGANRHVLDAVVKGAAIFEAWEDQPWVNEGAAVRVSLVCFGRKATVTSLNGASVERISADLTSTTATERDGAFVLERLAENRQESFFGFCLAGKFKIHADLAKRWIALPNAHGKPNSDVLSPIYNGADLTRRWSGTWTVDFGANRSEADSALYEAPFQHLIEHVKGDREANNRPSRAAWWFRHGEARPGLRARLRNIDRYIATVETSKHRFFVFLPGRVAPEHSLIVVPRADDCTFGLLECSFHRLWTMRYGSPYGNHPTARRYNASRTFEPFPFPAGLTPTDTAHQRTEALQEGALIPADLQSAVKPQAAAIARAAARLNTLRERWLNPPEWTERLPEVVPLGQERSPYPDRIVPRSGFEKQLAARTLTKLYNERPAWLAQAHEALDAAVAAAYGWTDWTAALPDDEILRRLLALNRERAAAAAPGGVRREAG